MFNLLPGDNLSNESIQVGVCGSIDVEIFSTNFINCLIVDYKGHLAMLQGWMGVQNCIVRFDHRR